MITILAMQFIDNIPKSVQYILFAIEALYIVYKFIYVIRSTKSNSKDLSKLMDKLPDIIYQIKAIFEKSANGTIANEELNEINKILENIQNGTNDNQSKD